MGSLERRQIKSRSPYGELLRHQEPLSRFGLPTRPWRGNPELAFANRPNAFPLTTGQGIAQFAARPFRQTEQPLHHLRVAMRNVGGFTRIEDQIEQSLGIANLADRSAQAAVSDAFW